MNMANKTRSCLRWWAVLGAIAAAGPLRAQLPVPPESPAPVRTFEYDAHGNRTKTVEGAGMAGFGFESEAAYDTLNRLKRATNAKLGETAFGYDGQSRTTSVRDPRNLLTQYPRNGLGDTTQLVSPDTGTATHTYDAAGNLVTRTDSRGVLGAYSYDVLNRLRGAVYSKSGQPSETISWGYDNVGTGYSNGIGRLTRTDHPGGSSRYLYDPQGRLIEYVQALAATAGGNTAAVISTTKYGYDNAGHLTSITYPSGRKVVYTYTDGELTEVGLTKDASSTPAPLVTQVQWEPFGGVRSWSWQMASGPVPHERVYDTSGRLVRYPLGDVVRDITYDAADRITANTHYSLAGVPQTALDQTFSYDELGRLTWITTAATDWAIAYDANGNRTSVTASGNARAYTIAADSNRLLNISNPARAFAHDNAGNTTSDSAAYTAAYSLSNRLASLSRSGIDTVYTYDAHGQRVRKYGSNGAASTVIFVYDQEGKLLGEYDGAGAAAREYVWLGNTPIAMFTPNPVAGGSPVVYFVHTDHLDTPRVVLDTAGQKRWRWMAEPFGTSAPETNPDGAGVFTQNLRFPGQYADQESGLFYNYFRDYDGSTGRYVQSDPIGLNGGINTFSYAEARPNVAIDPLGLATYMCTQPLHALGTAGRWIYAPNSNPFYHQFIGILKKDGSTITGGQDREGGPWGPGTPSKGDAAPGSGAVCERVEDDNECLETCLIGEFSKPRPTYALIAGGATNGGQNCQEWANNTLEMCRNSCKAKK